MKFNCKACGKTFVKYISGDRGAKYCSRKCYLKEPIKRPVVLKPIACGGCGVKFQPTWSGRKFCSKACVHASITVHQPTPCETCGELITKKGRKRRFCTYECSVAAPRPKVLVEKQCLCCKKRFQPRWGSRGYCSAACGIASRRKPREVTHCVECGKELSATCPKEQRFCCVRCAVVNRGGAKTGRKRAGLGKTYKNPQGYVMIKVEAGHPGSRAGGWMLQHRKVMQEHIGRTLHKWETVHHKNGDRADNRLRNLELCFSRHFAGQRLEDLLAFVAEHYAVEMRQLLEPKK